MKVHFIFLIESETAENMVLQSAYYTFKYFAMLSRMSKIPIPLYDSKPIYDQYIVFNFFFFKVQFS